MSADGGWGDISAASVAAAPESICSPSAGRAPRPEPLHVPEERLVTDAGVGKRRQAGDVPDASMPHRERVLNCRGHRRRGGGGVAQVPRSQVHPHVMPAADLPGAGAGRDRGGEVRLDGAAGEVSLPGTLLVEEGRQLPTLWPMQALLLNLVDQ